MRAAVLMSSSLAKVSSSGVQYTRSSPWLRKRTVTGSTRPSCRTPTAICMKMGLLALRTAVLCQKYRVRWTGTATMFKRLIDVEVRCLGVVLPLLSNQILMAWDYSAIACMAVVLPQLLGPMNTAGCSRSSRHRFPNLPCRLIVFRFVWIASYSAIYFPDCLIIQSLCSLL